MTVSNDKGRIQFTGNGVTTSFTFPSRVLEDSHLKVYENTTEKTLTTHYTVTKSATETTVDFVTAPADGVIVTIVRNVPRTQQTDYVEDDPFPSDSHEDALDKLTMIVQQMADVYARSLKFGETESMALVPVLPTPVGNAVLTWDGTGGTVKNGPTTTHLANAETYATNAAASATAAAASATNAAASASAAANSEAAAQALADSFAIRDIVYVTNADSPVTLDQAGSGKMYSVDTSSGAVVFNLPAISGLTLPYQVAIKKATGDLNTVTINAVGSDVIDGEADKIMSSIGGTVLRPDDDPDPDEWVSADFGASFGAPKEQTFEAGTDFTAGVDDTVTITNTPLPATNVFDIFWNGLRQSGWTYNGSTGVVAFGTVIPSDITEITARWSTTLSIGVPADGSVSTAKLADDAVTYEKTGAAVKASLDKADTAIQQADLEDYVSAITGASGDIKIGSLVIKRGSVTGSPGATGTVTFGTNFPNACRQVICQATQDNRETAVTSKSTTGFNYSSRQSSGSALESTFDWIAIGD